MCPDSTSSSLERLTDIGDGGVVEGDTTPAASPQVDPVSDTNEGVVGYIHNLCCFAFTVCTMLLGVYLVSCCALLKMHAN